MTTETKLSQLTEVAEELRDMADRLDGANDAPRKRENRVAVIVRFDPSVLSKLDTAAQKRGVSRSSLVGLDPTVVSPAAIWQECPRSTAFEDGTTPS